MSIPHEELKLDSPGEWSQWEWDASVQQYFRQRLNLDTRKIEYRYSSEEGANSAQHGPYMASSSAHGSSVSLSIRLPPQTNDQTSAYNMLSAVRSSTDIGEGTSSSENAKAVLGEDLPRGPIAANFACPYYQKYPKKYQNWTPCSGPGMTMLILKKHVRKCHKLPVQCLRCSEVFDNKIDLATHCQSDIPCIKHIFQRSPGFNDDQERKLAVLGEPNIMKLPEEEQWACLFRILFPNDHEHPSPFYQNSKVWGDNSKSARSGLLVWDNTALGLPGTKAEEWEDPFSVEKCLAAQAGQHSWTTTGDAAVTGIYGYGTDRNGVPRLVFPKDQIIGQLDPTTWGFDAQRDICDRHHKRNRRCSTLCLDRKHSPGNVLDGSTNIKDSKEAGDERARDECDDGNQNLSNSDCIRLHSLRGQGLSIPAFICPACNDAKSLAIDERLSVLQIDEEAGSEEFSEYWDSGEIATEEDQLQDLDDDAKTEIVRKAIVDLLLLKAYQISSPPSCKQCGDIPGSSSAAPSGRDASTIKSSPLGGQKHSLDRDESSQQEGDDQRKRMKPGNEGAVHFHGKSDKLACPFFQRSPLKHQNVTCVGPGFVDIKRLKEHLKRQHVLPLHCRRCWTVFSCNQNKLPKQGVQTAMLDQARQADEEERDAHVQSPEACQPRPDQALEGIKNGQLRQLFDRNSYSPDLSLEEKWRAVYHMIWPKDKKIPSAFYEYFSSTTAGINPLFEMEVTCDYREYFTTEHPKLLTERIGEIFSENRSMLVPGFEHSLQQLYKECEKQVRINFNRRQRDCGSTSKVPADFTVNGHNGADSHAAVTPRSFSPDADTPEAVSTPQAEPSSSNADFSKDKLEYDFATSQMLTEEAPQKQSKIVPQGRASFDAIASSYCEQDHGWNAEELEFVDWDQFDEDAGLDKSC